MHPTSKKITARPKNLFAYIAEMWDTRHVGYALTLRDLKQQYVQTRLGLVWAVLKPATIVLVFTFFFSYLMKIQNIDYAYPLFVLTGLMGWNLFATIFNSGSGVIVANAHVFRRMSFPLLHLPFLSVANALVEWCINFLLLLVLFAVFGHPVPWTIIFLPIALFINILPGLGMALWMNILTIRYRDLNHLIPYLVGFGIWLTPVFFPVTLLPEDYSWILSLNPMTGVLNLYRVFLFNEPLNTFAITWTLGVSFLLLLSGCLVFIRKESDMIDYI